MTRVIVTAVRAREPFIQYLYKHIPHLEVVWDKRQNAMDTFLRATELAGNDPVIRMEEDVCLTRHWNWKVEKEISQRPNEFINFFSRSKHDAGMGSHYRNGSRFNYNLCAYYPAGFAAGVLKHYSIWGDREKHPTGTDLMVADYLHSLKLNYWQVVPSLVDHAVTVSEIDRRRPRSRESTTFTEPELDGYPLTKENK